MKSLSEEVVRQVEITVKYAGYIERQEVEAQKFKSLEDKTIPIAFDFSTVPSFDLRQGKSSPRFARQQSARRPASPEFRLRTLASCGLLKALGRDKRTMRFDPEWILQLLRRRDRGVIGRLAVRHGFEP